MHLRVLVFLLVPFTAALAQVAVQNVAIDGKLVAYTVQDGFAVTQGDIILGRAEDVEGYRVSQTARGAGRIASPQSIHAILGGANAKLWPNATIYYTIDPSAPVQQNLLDAIAYWNKVGPFQVLPRDGQPNYVTFRALAADAACNSYIGMSGGQQFIGVTNGCSVGAAIHEIGHAWGLLHEHVRGDRAAHITVLYDNIDKRYYPDFDQSTSSQDSGYYDFDSIMHYGPGGFGRVFEDTLETVPPGIPIGQRTALSAGDIDGVSRLYGFAPKTTTITTVPSGLPVTVDGTTANSPQSFTWTPGSQHTVAVEALQGTSPRYVFAGWSDDGAAAHSVTASADRTVYCANFSRQYPVQVGLAAGAGTATAMPASADGYLPDRFPLAVTATPVQGFSFLRWTGNTALGSSGLGVSANPARVEVRGAPSSYQAFFTQDAVTVVDSKPRGALLSVDGLTYFTPAQFLWTPGSQHTLSYTTPQTEGNNTTRFQFVNWDDGTTGTRTVTAGSQAATYTAQFRQQFLLSTGTIGTGTVTVAPSSPDGFYDAGSEVRVTAQPGAGQTLRYWIGDAIGTSPQQTVVLNEERSATANFGSALPWLLLNAANFALNPFYGYTGQSVAPGEIVTIFGTNIGPSNAVSPAAGSDGRLPSEAGGVSVRFDGFAAAITYASANQINLVVPYGIAGQSSTTVSILRSGAAGQSFGLSVYSNIPGLFSVNGTGKGPVAALNQNGSVNSEQNPADAGSVVVLYGTGAGLMAKSIPDGQVAGADLVLPASPVFVRVGKLPAQVLYAGSAPGLVSGALQVNVLIPKETFGGGQTPIQLIAGPYTSAPGTTIWVR